MSNVLFLQRSFEIIHKEKQLIKIKEISIAPKQIQNIKQLIFFINLYLPIQ